MTWIQAQHNFFFFIFNQIAHLEKLTCRLSTRSTFYSKYTCCKMSWALSWFDIVVLLFCCIRQIIQRQVLLNESLLIFFAVEPCKIDPWTKRVQKQNKSSRRPLLPRGQTPTTTFQSLRTRDIRTAPPGVHNSSVVKPETITVTPLQAHSITSQIPLPVLRLTQPSKYKTYCTMWSFSLSHLPLYYSLARSELMAWSSAENLKLRSLLACRKPPSVFSCSGS